MIHSIKKAITIFSLVIFGSVVLYNCEPDADTLGEQLFLDGAAQGNEESFDITAFNINNNDTIQSDASKLGLATLGAFNEPQFGKQKASYFTQLRLSTYDPDFGTNPVIDSVVLVIKPTYASDSVKTNTVDDGFTFTTATDANINAKKVVNTYPVNKYGRAKIGSTTAPFNIQVHEVTDFLKGASDRAASNSDYNVGALLGEKSFDGNISSVTITKDDDGSALFTASTPGIRIKLDNEFFKSKIIAYQDKPELQDASNFIRHFKGLKISATQDDGYLMQFNPNDLELIMYYKYDKTDVPPATKPQVAYAFALGSGNVHIGHYEYDRAGTPLLSEVNQPIGTIGHKKLFLQGMGGPSIGVKIPGNTFTELRNRYKNDRAAIISAKIRISIDNESWDSKAPKLTAFSIVDRYIDTTNNKEKFKFLSDLLNLVGSNNFSIYKAYLDKSPAYYDFTVTQSIKDIIETKDDVTINPEEYIRIDMGSFLSNSQTNALVGANTTSRAYARDRVVFVGSNTTDPKDKKRAHLVVTYGTKK
ncbi:hypothetical protein ASG22_03915 [Chryseobacterium sp. Leaf405]|uniref:DUF4270 domain-containing protein n=1 Tax=Chryseobacterium sp. Leaf405 TaxID=1736367 RepID=UPI0006F5A0AA|nr:DUF4270 domain-containing protein [Chryseobacterium sp. Leaf405]KQT25855.1 hypothetical protein ASG22_03915 [Chryseobacterium sp. Leaf405]